MTMAAMANPAGWEEMLVHEIPCTSNEQKASSAFRKRPCPLARAGVKVVMNSL